jgi:hypothetical protein
MSKIHKHERARFDFKKEARLDKLYEEINRNRRRCGCGCINYEGGDGYCPLLGRGVIVGSECEVDRITRERTRG